MNNNETVLWILCMAILILLLLFTLTLINYTKRTKAEKAAILVGEKLKKSYADLEHAYEESKSTKLELDQKYEQLKKSQEKIRQLAYCDYLTGMPNRVALVEMLDSIMETLRQDEKIGLFDIDIDNFKDINDSLGHSYGDEMLLDVIHRLKNALGEEDYIARIGGDEFMVLIQNFSDDTELNSKLACIQEVFKEPFTIATREFFVTVSIGISIAPKDGKTTQHLMKNTNSAMYVAKEHGKNTFRYFDESINQRLLEKLETQSELRKAIEENQICPYYQAQIDLVQDKIVGFEALARWNHPSRGIIPPMQFIPLAEENGMIVKIGEKMLRDACLQLNQWIEQGYSQLTMAVNFSARQFKDGNFLDMVHRIIRETGLDPSMLEFEITETVALEDMQYTVNTINQLRKVGINFSLDDFGTGFSSLNYLKQLPVNNLKIDKSFLDTILENKSDQKIVHTMIQLAQNLNIEVIAEGVEVGEQETFLKNSKCEKAQGFLYSRPVPPQEALEVLKIYNKNA